MLATLARLRRLLELDLTVFDDARYDPTATVWSLVVAAASMALFALGGWFWWVFSGMGDAGAVFLKSVVLGTLFALALWLVWLLAVYAVLQRLTGRALQMDELVRAAGLATAPLALGLLMLVPAISFGAGLFALAMWVLTTQIAVERASGADTGQAMIANLAGFGAWVMVMSLLATGNNQLAPGPFLAESIWDAVTALDVGSALLR